MLTLRERLQEIDRLLLGQQRSLSFLAPATAACLAAARRSGAEVNVRFTGHAESYAHTVGLDAILAGGPPPRIPVTGRSYSPLVELDSHASIEGCNAVINELVEGQLTDYPALADQAAQIIGELHDNVPSHAGGVGFSMAQLYSVEGFLELAVVDCGRGMLSNVRRRVGSIGDHAAAIEWCLEKGHTSVLPPDEWAQRLPDDAMSSPYGETVATRTSDNHHAGLGLWKLNQIVTAARGEFVVWSGDARVLTDVSGASREGALFWRGVAIILRLPLASAPRNGDQPAQLHELEALAKRLSL
jgi:hypothetical protein